MKKTIQPTFNEVEYDSIVKLSNKKGFSTPSGLVKYATMQYINSFKIKDKLSQLSDTESIPMILQESENISNLSEQQRKDLQCVIKKEFEL